MGDYIKFGSHWPVLVEVALRTSGPVLELGTGWGSTPILHMLCENRPLLSVDDNMPWLKTFMHFNNRNHKFLMVNKYLHEEHEFYKAHWNVVFVDHADYFHLDHGDRVHTIKKMRKNVEIFVLHDTEVENYNKKIIEMNFKYKYDYKEKDPWTSIISDTIDVSDWKPRINVPDLQR